MKFWHQVLDRSIVFSFDRNGFKRHERQFDPEEQHRNLSGRNFLITGSNSGIGFAATEQLGRRGAHVLLACRSTERGEAAVETLRSRVPTGSFELRQVDMADLSSVKRLSKTIGAPLHGLIHNAGNMLDEYQTTAEGIEYITSLHVVGPHHLSLGLQKQLEAGAHSGGARIIFVSSGGMYTQGLKASELFHPSKPYDGMRHYAHTKRAQVVLAQQMHGRLSPLGVAVHSMHPGWVDTAAVRRAMPKFTAATKWILRSPNQGADTISWLAGYDGDIDQESGFWFDRKKAPLFMTKRASVPPVEIQRMMQRLRDLDASG
jgi:NAD(P)-dependent dehydrogenase (short-subunit alcohol dehydrogenase family)